ncbi:MAG: hypothetical protein HY644_10405 [Acidobacteria bacterium]|nr:hypothetical protein [Acidobacteriota bacterium]
MTLLYRTVTFLILLLTFGLCPLAQQNSIVNEINRQLPILLGQARSASDPQHTPQLKVPRVVEMASEVMVTVSMPLVGDQRHYIRRLALIDENSLIKVKYVASFSSLVRPLQVTTLIKMATNSQIKAIAECSLHGKWLGVSDMIQVGIGSEALKVEAVNTAQQHFSLMAWMPR